MIAWWTFWRGWEKFDCTMSSLWFGLVRCKLVKGGRVASNQTISQSRTHHCGCAVRPVWCEMHIPQLHLLVSASVCGLKTPLSVNGFQVTTSFQHRQTQKNF